MPVYTARMGLVRLDEDDDSEEGGQALDGEAFMR